MQYRKRNGIWHVRLSVKERQGDKIVTRRIERSTKSADRRQAEIIAAQFQAELTERHLFGKPKVGTFSEAVLMYIQAGKSKRFIATACGTISRMYHSTRLTSNQSSAALLDLYPGRAPETINRQVFTPVTAIMTLAAESGLCPAVKFRRPKMTRKPVTYPTDVWFEAVLPECSPHLAALITCMTFTSLRVSEAVSIKSRDVDLSRGLALVKKTKPGPPRQIDLNPIVVAAIANMPDWSKREKLFGYASRHSVYGPLQRACERAGVEYFGPHKLGRHKFAARLLDDGYTLKDLMDAGAWSSIRMVAENYGHLEHRRVRNAVLSQKWKKA